jgi:GMP synthase (glutamine-hydrolysing)
MILLVNLNSEGLPLSTEEFIRPIESALDGVCDCSVVPYKRVTDDLLAQADKVILSGTTLKDMDYLNNMSSFSWISGCKKPILGICAGMQVLAMGYGSTLVDCREIGLFDIDSLKDNPLFSGKFKAYCLHKKAVEPSSELEVLARSLGCVQAIKHIKTPQYGVLFHPEVRNIEILRKFALL